MSPKKGEAHQDFLARRRAHAKTPEQKKKAREAAVLHRRRYPDKIREQNRKYYARRPGVRGKLKSTYGITVEQYDLMLADQKGLCAACSSAPREGRILCVDHCHSTGRVRGLLCTACNICAGYIESARYEGVKHYLKLDYSRTDRPGCTSFDDQGGRFNKES